MYLKTLLIFILMVNGFCLGQKADTMNVTRSTISRFDTTTIFRGTSVLRISRDTIVAVRDTVKIILLVCDTSKVNIGGATFCSIMKEGECIGEKNTLLNVYWRYGYWIRQKRYSEYASSTWSDGYWEPIYTLDSNFKPFSKNIIVWLTKTLK